MLTFVNAKINIGLSVVERRADGYHLLNTCFYPVGIHNGTPRNPEPFGDILELTTGHLPVPEADAATGAVSSYDAAPFRFIFTGNRIDCPPEKNLVVRAAQSFRSATGCDLPLTISLRKMIPDGAGLGGGSADATFTLRMLNRHTGSPLSDTQLEELALRLGADCPVFVKNQPTFAEGIGEIFSPIDSDSIRSLSERPYWLALVKPALHISTREAFAGIHPHYPAIPLREALRRPIEEWRHTVVNDFEQSLFPLYPLLGELKAALYDAGAIYASMTGSGAALYGIFPSRREAAEACRTLSALQPDLYSSAIML